MRRSRKPRRRSRSRRGIAIAIARSPVKKRSATKIARSKAKGRRSKKRSKQRKSRTSGGRGKKMAPSYYAAKEDYRAPPSMLQRALGLNAGPRAALTVKEKELEAARALEEGRALGIIE